jgi:hypothetical protein
LGARAATRPHRRAPRDGEAQRRVVAGSLVATFPKDHSASTISGWIDAGAEDVGKLARRAKLGLEAASTQKQLLAELVTWLNEAHPALLDSTDPDARALKKKLDAIERQRAKKSGE